MWNFINELAERLRSASPTWFKRLQVIIGVIMILFSAAQTAISMGYLPEFSKYTDLITGILSGLAVAFGVSFTAKKDPINLMDGPGGAIPPPGKPDPRG